MTRPASLRDSLDALSEPNEASIGVVYTMRTYSYGYPAETVFRQPDEDRFGHGVIIRTNDPWILAHEIGHALGLPHTPRNDTTSSAIEGVPFSTYCLQPFRNDLTRLSFEDEARNLMQDIRGASTGDINATWLSKAQANRARLTIVSRRCPYSRVYLDPISETSRPLLADIGGAFAMETFPVEMRGAPK